MGAGGKEAGLAEALCCRLAEPGDKKLQPAWPLWQEVMQDSGSLFGGITWSRASGPAEWNELVGLFSGWVTGFMVDRLTAWLTRTKNSWLISLFSFSFCAVPLLPSPPAQVLGNVPRKCDISKRKCCRFESQWCPLVYFGAAAAERKKLEGLSCLPPTVPALSPAPRRFQLVFPSCHT